jgi:sulfate permease, SulP family
LVNIERTPLSECPPLKIVCIDGSLFFGAVDYPNGKLRELAALRRANSGSLSLVGLKEAARSTFKRSDAVKHVHQFFASKHEAIAALYEIFDRDSCVNCTRRVFIECQRTPRPADAAEKAQPTHLASDAAINQIPY